MAKKKTSKNKYSNKRTPNSHKGSFVQKNYIALISLIIALIGGIPGTIAVLEYLDKKPDFTFTPVSRVTGQMMEGNESLPFLMLAGTISNQGNESLIPKHFELECKIDGQWVMLEKRLIPKEVSFSGPDNLEFGLEPWQKDLQRFDGDLPKNKPVPGYLLFVSRDTPLKKLHSRQLVKMRLICVDIYDESYISKFDWKFDDSKGGIMYPKHDFTITPN